MLLPEDRDGVAVLLEVKVTGGETVAPGEPELLTVGE